MEQLNILAIDGGNEMSGYCVSVPLRGFLFLTRFEARELRSSVARVSVPLRGFLFLTIGKLNMMA